VRNWWLGARRIGMQGLVRARIVHFARPFLHVFKNIVTFQPSAIECLKKRRSDEGVKAQTYAQVVLRRGGAAKHNLPTANNQQPTANSQQRYACDVRFVRPNRVLYALSPHFGEVIQNIDYPQHFSQVRWRDSASPFNVSRLILSSPDEKLSPSRGKVRVVPRRSERSERSRGTTRSLESTPLS